MASTSAGAHRRLLGGLLTTLLAFAPAVLANPDLPAVELMLHHRPPYYTVQDAEPGGIVVEPVLRALSDSGLRHFWTDIPPSRQLHAIQNGRMPVCGVGWFKTPERAGFAQFSRPLYTDLPMVVLTRADNEPIAGFDTLEALFADPDLTLGVRQGYAYGTVIDRLLDQNQPRVFPSDRDSAGMAALLLAGVFDYMMLASEEVDSVRFALRTDFSALQLQMFDDIPLGSSRHLMCSQAVPRAWIEQLDRALPMTSADVDQRPP